MSAGEQIQVGDVAELLCGACGELISGGMSLFQCSHCRNDLHDPEACSDVWVLEDGCNFWVMRVSNEPHF